MKELINKTPAMMDRASVYRTVTLFEKLGIVQRINIGWKYRIELSDKFADHHHHLVCTKCSKIIPIDADNLEVFIEQVAAQNKFKAINHQVEIQGLCNKCRD
jgi:Fur family ferric uptake transcriptional regulator